VHRHIHRAGYGIETRHLQAGAEVVIPHDGGGIFALGEIHILIAGGAPCVIEHCLAKADCAVGQFHLADFAVHPVRQFAGHVARGHGPVRQGQRGAADILDAKTGLLTAGLGGGGLGAKAEGRRRSGKEGGG
jgi:hypothetical protein